jgi:hypothetical protein
MTLDSKIAVVTGSSKGIGKPIALAFAKSKEYRGFYFTWRDNDDPNLPWGKGLSGNVELVGTSLGHIDSVSLIQSNFGTDNNSPLNLEAIVSAGGGPLSLLANIRCAEQ